jgi:hypothetical protein
MAKEKDLKIIGLQYMVFFIYVSLLIGCAGQTAPLIPDTMAAISNDKARIVVTRKKQIAGAMTPIYILDMGRNVKANADIAIRVGNYIKEPGLSLWYAPMVQSVVPSQFMLLPTGRIDFEESKTIGLNDLIEENTNATIYVDHLKCDHNKPAAIFCGKGKSRCGDAFEEELRNKKGVLLSVAGMPLESIEHQKVHRAQVVGRVMPGDTLIWDREPGVMRAAAFWGGSNRGDHTLLLTQGNIVVESGKTYYLQYSVKLGERWTIQEVK